MCLDDKLKKENACIKKKLRALNNKEEILERILQKQIENLDVNNRNTKHYRKRDTSINRNVDKLEKVQEEQYILKSALIREK